MDWKNSEVEVSSIVKQAIKDLHDARPSEHFYTFALYTDTSAMTVAMAANSLEALELNFRMRMKRIAMSLVVTINGLPQSGNMKPGAAICLKGYPRS